MISLLTIDETWVTIDKNVLTPLRKVYSYRYDEYQQYEQQMEKFLDPDLTFLEPMVRKTTKLIVFYDKMEDTMTLKDSGFLIKVETKTIKNEA